MKLSHAQHEAQAGLNHDYLRYSKRGFVDEALVSIMCTLNHKPHEPIMLQIQPMGLSDSPSSLSPASSMGGGNTLSVLFKIYLHCHFANELVTQLQQREALTCRTRVFMHDDTSITAWVAQSEH